MNNRTLKGLEHPLGARHGATDSILTPIRLQVSVSGCRVLGVKFQEYHNSFRNKLERVNPGRVEAGETMHHLYMAMLKNYITETTYEHIRARYEECIRMLNGLEKKPENKWPDKERRRVCPRNLKNAFLSFLKHEYPTN